MTYETEVIIEFMEKMMGPLMITSLLGLVASVFLALCVYNDAKVRGNGNAVMWAVLSGLFNIVALIYIIVQAASKPKPVYCMRCGNIVPQGYGFCPVCNTVAPAADILPPEEMAKKKKMRLIFLILFIVVFAASTVYSVFMMRDMMQFVFDFTSTYTPY